MISDADFWTLTILLGLGTFLIRFSFLGFLGGRPLPARAQLYLKYVGVAVFPALVAPLVLWPAASDGQTDPARIIAALSALLIGLRFGVVWSIVAGMAVLYTLQWLFPLI